MQKWPPSIPGKEFRMKKKELKEYSFEERESIEIGSEYFSCENDSTKFYKIDDDGIRADEACCSTKECNIY
jgi:hypothetical protein